MVLHASEAEAHEKRDLGCRIATVRNCGLSFVECEGVTIMRPP